MTFAPWPLVPSPAPDTCLAFLVRHGATDASRADPVRMQGRGTDGALSDEGRRQADEVARFLSATPLAAVFTSPMRRARDTAAAIAAPHELTPTAVDELIEAELGRWEGRTWPEIAASEPEEYQAFVERPDLYGYGGGENIAQVRDRALPSIDRLMAGHVGAAIGICAHRIVIRACVAELLGVPLAESRRVSPSTGGVTLLRHRPGMLEVVTFNAVFHLGDAGH